MIYNPVIQYPNSRSLVSSPIRQCMPSPMRHHVINQSLPSPANGRLMNILKNSVHINQPTINHNLSNNLTINGSILSPRKGISYYPTTPVNSKYSNLPNPDQQS